MKFECDSCHAQYMIADEKVGKRGVKVKCKKCQHVIIVRPDGASGPKEAPPKNDAPAPAEKADKRAPREEQPAATAVAPPPPGLDVNMRAGDGDGDSDGDGFAQGGATDPGIPDLRNAAEPPSDDIPPPTPETTGPGFTAPAPVSLFGDATQLTKNPLNESLPDVPKADDRTELSAAVPQMSAQTPGQQDDAPPQQHARGRGGDATVVTPQAPPSDDDEPPAPPPEPPVVSSPSRASAESGLDDELAGAFNAMFDPSQVPSQDEDGDQHRGPTRVLDTEAMNALRERTANPMGLNAGGDPRDLEAGLVRGPAGPSAPSSVQARGNGGLDSDESSPGGADDGPAEQVWHVAIDDQDVGPLSLAEVGRHIEGGRVDRDSLVWKVGMDDWLPAGEVPAVRALFDKVPMPRIARVDDDGPRARRGGAADSDVDVGDGLPPSAKGLGGSPFDEPSDDAAWRPHGLTDVYQAANLAEMAGAGMGGIGGLSAGGSSSPSSSVLSAKSSTPPSSSGSDSEWRPGAASALSALVQDEMKRIDSPMPAADDDLSPADDASINAPLFGSLGAGPSLEAGPDVGVIGAPRAGAGAGAMAPAALPTVAPASPSYPPGGFMTAPPQRQGLSPLVLGGIAGGALLVVLVVVLVVVVALRGGDDDNKIVLGPDGKPYVMVQGKLVPVGGAGAAAAAAGNDKKPDEATKVAANVDKPGDKPDDKVAAGDDKKPEAADDKKPEAADDKKPDDGKLASAAAPAKNDDPPTAVHKEPRSQPRREVREKKDRDPPPPPPVSHATPKGCDPVLDFDCKPGGGKSESSKAAEKGGDVKDKLTPSDVLLVVKSHLGAVQACGRKHKATGVIKMAWKIQQRGNVTDVNVADSKFAGTPAGACVTSEVKGWRFPASRSSSPVPVTMPMGLGG